MSKDLQEPQKPSGTNEEIDIIKIFNLIGNAIKSVFDFIISILEYIFKLFIIFSLFVKRNLRFLSVAFIIGLIGGGISDYFKESFYTSTMIVEPNFNINNQLIESIKLYGQLSKSKDSITLSGILGITPGEASKIERIRIKPVGYTNERIIAFNEFIKDADTSLINKITFQEYEKNTSVSEYKQYAIKVDAKDREIFRKIENKLAAIPVSNYIAHLQKVELDNLDKHLETINESYEKVEQLRADYKKLMLLEVDSDQTKPLTSGNNFYFGSEKLRPTNELELFKIEENYRAKIDKINIEKAKKVNIVNVISGFQEIGTRVKESYKIWYIIGALSIAVLFLLLKQFNNYLSQYEKKLKSGNA